MHKISLLSLLLVASLIGFSCSGEPKTLEDLRAAGLKAFNKTEWNSARGYFQKALLKAPSDKQLLYFTGLCYKRESMYDSAVVFLKKADFLYPKDREINIALREVAEKTGDWKYALGAISVLISTGDNVENYWDDLARLTAKNSEPLITMYYQRKLQVRDHENVTQWTRLISVALKLDSIEVGRTYLDSAYAKFGPSDELLTCKGQLESALGHMVEAEKIFRSLLAKRPDYTPYKYNLANLLASANDKATKIEAINLLKEIPADEGKDYKVDSLIMLIQKQVDKM
jgi:tetratricopeptide (TPR) repeat protein